MMEGDSKHRRSRRGCGRGYYRGSCSEGSWRTFGSREVGSGDGPDSGDYCEWYYYLSLSLSTSTRKNLPACLHSGRSGRSGRSDGEDSGNGGDRKAGAGKGDDDDGGQEDDGKPEDEQEQRLQCRKERRRRRTDEEKERKG